MQKLFTSLSLGSALIAANATAQQVSFARHFKVGQSYSYRTTSTSTGTPKLDMVMMESMKVIKVYPNGDADLKTSVETITNKINGKAMPATKMKPVLQKVDKFGIVKSNSATAGVMGISGADLSKLMPKTLSVGHTIKSHMSLSNVPMDYSYSLKLESLRGSIAQVKMTMVMTYQSAQAKIPPMRGEGTMLYDTHKENFTSMIFAMAMPSMGSAGGKMISKTVLLQH